MGGGNVGMVGDTMQTDCSAPKLIGSGLPYRYHSRSSPLYRMFPLVRQELDLVIRRALSSYGRFDAGPLMLDTLTCACGFVYCVGHDWIAPGLRQSAL